MKEVLSKVEMLKKKWRYSLFRISQETQQNSAEKDGYWKERSLRENIKVKEYLSRLLESHSNPRILDVGAGIFWRDYIPEKYWDNTTKVDWVDNQGENNFIKADVEENLPFDDASFDIVLSKQLFSSLKNQNGVISEMKRVTKDTIIIIDYEGEQTDGKTRISIFEPMRIEEEFERIGLKEVESEVVDHLNYNKLQNNLTAVIGRK